MRNPNGYGSITKLSGKRRRPYMVRKTTGYNANGSPISVILGYFASKKEANIALAEYNKNPWNLDHVKITFKELYDLWLEKKAPKLGKSNREHLKAAYIHAKSLWDIPYKSLKSFHMQEIIDNCGFGHASQNHIKNLFKHLDNFALEIDIINKGYSSLVSIEEKPESDKTPFTDEEINKLWEHSANEWVQTILIYLYTGFRLNELLKLQLEQINMENQTFQGGSKTKAGKNRIVPIHNRILPFILARLKVNSKYLFEYRGQQINTTKYYRVWKLLMLKMEMQHTVHECRHTFRSRLDSAGVSKTTIDLLMGHKSNSVGERVYTHKTLEELKEGISKLL